MEENAFALFWNVILIQIKLDHGKSINRKVNKIITSVM